MGDSSETGSVATTTTAILFRPGYFCTLSGFLKLEELVSGIFCWVLVASTPGLSGPLVYVAIMGVVVWFLTLCSALFYLFAVYETSWSKAPWLAIEIFFSIFFALSYISILVVEIVFGNFATQLLTASTTFACVTTAIYLFHIFHPSTPRHIKSGTRVVSFKTG
ncbi:uncharacterized protein LOC143462414 [Clavelina lepadiformis]|uniref:uncharacterized protein LOC143462414 n=1 Tax=Clavelina lepadiformis TaxID=159417 RepID=UPI00404353B1